MTSILIFHSACPEADDLHPAFQMVFFMRIGYLRNGHGPFDLCIEIQMPAQTLGLCNAELTELIFCDQPTLPHQRAVHQ